MKSLFRTGIFIFLLDLLLISAHLSLGQTYFLFHLDFEHNVPTVYQGLKLIVIANLAFLPLFAQFLLKKLKRTDLLNWSPMVIIFLFLALDELAQIHENLHGYLSQLFPILIDDYTGTFMDSGYQSSDWLLLYLPLFILFGGYLLAFGKYLLKKDYKYFLFLIAGMGLMFLVPIAEYLNTSGINESDYFLLMTLEESLEMIGVSFFFILVYRNFRETISSLMSIKSK